MFVSNLKEKIKEIAMTAVQVAEDTLGSNKGQEKKILAINYVVEHLPLPIPLKLFFSFFLSNFIDDAIEFAVKYMKGEL